MEETDRPGIDRLDLRLLDILQRQGALSVAEVAAQTRISTTTCWRRIQQLEQSGVIKGRVALLDRNALGPRAATPSPNSKRQFGIAPKCWSATR